MLDVAYREVAAGAQRVARETSLAVSDHLRGRVNPPDFVAALEQGFLHQRGAAAEVERPSARAFDAVQQLEHELFLRLEGVLLLAVARVLERLRVEEAADLVCLRGHGVRMPGDFATQPVVAWSRRTT